MADQLVHNKAARSLANSGSPSTIRPSQLENATLNAGNEVTVWSKKVPADKVYAHGHGTNDRQVGSEAFIYVDLLADGTGTGTDGDSIEGDLYAVITDSEQRDVHARYQIGDLETLAAARDDNRTERPMQPVRVPVAREDQHLELRVVADDASDGTVVASDSGIRMYYTEFNN